MHELVTQKQHADFRTVVNFDGALGELSAAGYRYAIGSFGRWLEARGQHWLQVDSRTVVAYLNDLKKSERRPATINNHLKAIRRTFEAAVKEGQVESNPTDGVKYEKDTADRTARHKWMKPEQIEAIWRSIQDLTGEIGLRDRALFVLLASTGCRASEVCNIKWRDIKYTDGKPSEIFISRGKGNKPRHVEANEVILHHLLAYRLHLESIGFALVDDLVFYSTPTAGPRAPMSRFLLYNCVKRWTEPLGLKAWPHSFRHSFASNILRSGGDIIALAERLGHSSPSTTWNVYCHSDSEVLQHLPYSFNGVS